MSRDYTDEAFCRHCQKYTMHDIHDSEHERDSSMDSQECFVCGWSLNGFSGKYEPPRNSKVVVEALVNAEIAEMGEGE